MEYYIFLTNDCNLKCEYCSVLIDCINTHTPILPNYKLEDLAKFIFTTQKKYMDKKIDIYFFGGEPTLNYPFMGEIIDKINEFKTDYQINFILHTNGLLLSQIPKKILENINVIVNSINYQKITSNVFSDDYFGSLVKSIKHVISLKSIPTFARLTITEKTSLYANVVLTINFYDYVYWQIENKTEFENFSLFYKNYKFEMECLFEYWLKCLNHGHLLNLVPIVSAVKFCLFNDRSNNEFGCGYSHNMIYLQTDGNCYSCSDSVENKTHLVGDIYYGVELPNLPLDNFKCKSCIYKQLCKGRCGRMHREFSKKHINEYCTLNKVLFELVIKSESKIKNILEQFPKVAECIQSKMLEYTEFTS